MDCKAPQMGVLGISLPEGARRLGLGEKLNMAIPAKVRRMTLVTWQLQMQKRTHASFPLTQGVRRWGGGPNEETGCQLEKSNFPCRSDDGPVGCEA